MFDTGFYLIKIQLINNWKNTHYSCRRVIIFFLEKWDPRDAIDTVGIFCARREFILNYFTERAHRILIKHHVWVATWHAHTYKYRVLVSVLHFPKISLPYRSEKTLNEFNQINIILTHWHTARRCWVRLFRCLLAISDLGITGFI